MNHVKIYFAMVVFFVIFDLTWIGIVASSFYRKHLGFMLSDEVNWIPAILFYALYITGLLVFAVAPGLDAGSALRATLLGGFLGLLCYATYDLTNHATVKNWPAIVSVVDMTWGTCLSAALSFVGYKTGEWLGCIAPPA